MICYTATKGKFLKVADVSNCFQSDVIPIENEKRIFINAPVLCVEWFEKTYPDIKFDKSKKVDMSCKQSTLCKGEKMQVAAGISF